MLHMLVRHKVRDFDAWKRVFDSHAEAQRRASIRVTQVWRSVADLAEVVLLFDVDDVERAKRFVYAPAVLGSQQESGVVDTPHILFLSSVGRVTGISVD